VDLELERTMDSFKGFYGKNTSDSGEYDIFDIFAAHI